MTRSDLTALDRAHLAAEDAPGDETLRARIYETLADTELFVLLEGEPGEDQITPRIFALEEGPFVLAFDREDRLTEFTGGPEGYAALPGRVLAGMLAPQGLGLGLNLGAVSARLLPPDALDWLSGLLTGPLSADTDDATLSALPEARARAVSAALSPRLPALAGMGRALHLAQSDGGALHLSVEGAPTALHAPLAQMLAEALRFALPAEAAGAGIGFAETPPEGAAHRIPLPDLPEPQAVSAPEPKAPGSDPDRPPILKF